MTQETQQNKKYSVVTLKEKVSHRLQAMRYCRDLTQAEVASSLDLNKMTYCNYEVGKTEMSYDVLVRVARFFDCSLDWLLFVDEKAGD